MFQTLLQDEVAEVRVVAINAVTMILSRFWILLSAADLQVLNFISIFFLIKGSALAVL